MTSPLRQVPAICPEEGVDLVPDHLCTLILGLALAQAAGVTTTIMLTKTSASQVQPPSTGIHPGKGICTPSTTMMDITIAWTKMILFCHLLCSKGKEEEAHPEKGNCTSREN
jgi:hypothetical protein